MIPLGEMSESNGARLCALVVGIPVIGLALLVTGAAKPEAGEHAEAARPPVPHFAKMTPAANRPSLSLIVDERKVLGWVGGARSYAGRDVSIRVGGRAESVVVQADNTFTWYYGIDEKTAAAFAVGGLKRTVTLWPPAELEPSVFFVVDRTVYRPGHKVQFAAFLRSLGRDGKFLPIPGRKVAVTLRAKTKKTVAAKLDLTSDGFGRITGEYTFMGEDPLDEYTLSIDGFRGEAVVKLAEFRKAKVRLDITGKREREAVRLRFEARDFLNKPVAAKRLEFTAKVFRRQTLKKSHELNGEQFAYHAEGPKWLPDPDELTDEQRFRWVHLGAWPRTAQAVAAQLSQKVELNGEPYYEHELPVQPQWLDGRSTVMVEGVLIDQNGREQRAVKSIALGREASKARKQLVIDLPKRQFADNENIPITVRVFDANGEPVPTPANTSVVVMRQHASAGWPYSVQAVYPINQLYRSSMPLYARRSAYLPGNWRHAGSARVRQWQVTRPTGQSFGEMVTAAVVAGGKAAVAIGQPGTYDLVVMTHLPGGTTLREKTVCAVAASKGRSGLKLLLDRTVCQPGDVLGGEVHSRFRGARVLLTIRDGRGIRLWRTLDVAGGAVRFDQPVPDGLNYGCSVVAQYVDKGGAIHTAQRSVRITPADRILQVKTECAETYGPGEAVKLGIEVDRAEPVDLVVSVYDKSLLGVAADRSVDVRNFYLADERGIAGMARDILARKLGDMTLEDIEARAQAEVKADSPSPQARQSVSYARQNYVNVYILSNLLTYAGLPTRVAPGTGSWYCRLDRKKNRSHRILDLLDHRQGQYSLAMRMYDDMLVIAEAGPGRANAYQWVGPYGHYDRVRRGVARGDAHHSVSANASFAVSGQSFISHMPAGLVSGGETLKPDTPSGQTALRRDFSDSAFFSARVRTNDRGRANVKFKLPDSLTNWHVIVTAISPDMHVGHHTSSFRTFKPIMVWPMIPRVFTCGDKVRVFARVHNRTDKPQAVDVKLKVANGKVLGRDTERVTVAPKKSAAVYWTFEPDRPGYAQLLMTADSPAGTDASLKRLPVQAACSVEQLVTASGFCKDQAVFDVPETALGGSKLEITLSPSLVADMVDTLDYLVQYPHGCVEQTMSRFLPAVKVAQILKKVGLESKPLEEKLPRCVSGGIKRLLQLQRKDGGWGWNGSGRTHEMFTPYALYGLLEAERAGYPIPNESAIERGLARLRSFIDAMGAAQATDRIYCMYVYSYRKEMEAKWWQFIQAQLDGGKLSDYAIAMALEMAVRQKRASEADALARELRRRVKLADDRAWWTTANFSRWGNNRHEITAAAMKALVAVDPDDKLIAPVLAYFTRTKRGNRWNSTKDTAMVLLALCDYLAKKDLKYSGATSVTVAVNGGKPRKVEMAGGLIRKIVVPAGEVRTGRNVVKFGGGAFGAMYRLVFRYRKVGTDVGPFAAGVQVTRRMYLLKDAKPGAVAQIDREIKPGQTVPRGSYVLSEVTARRRTGSSMSYVLVESPKPSCAEIVPATDRRFSHTSSPHVLREDKTAAVLWHHERTGGTLVDRAVFHAELAGRYVIAPAYVELMYKTEVRGHSGTFQLNVAEGKPESEEVAAR